MEEQTLAQFELMIYKLDPSSNQWCDIGSSPGITNLLFLKSTSDQYRYVGVKKETNEVVINEYISTDTKYIETSETFYCLYLNDGSCCGLNFKNSADAKKCSSTIYSCQEHINNKRLPSFCESIPTPSPVHTPAPTPAPTPVVSVNNNNNSSLSKSTGKKKSKPQQTIQPTPPQISPNNAMPTNTAKDRKLPTPSSSAPPPPPAGGPPPPPPGPPPPPAGPSMKKPPPVQSSNIGSSSVGSGGGGGGGGSGGGFLDQLQAAANKKREINIPSTGIGIAAAGENNNTADKTPPPASGGSSGGGGDFLSEMRKRLAQKSQDQQGLKSEPNNPVLQKPQPSSIKPSDKIETGSSINVTHEDLEKIRQQILRDMTEKLEKMKNEIIEGICSRLQQ